MARKSTRTITCHDAQGYSLAQLVVDNHNPLNRVILTPPTFRVDRVYLAALLQDEDSGCFFKYNQNIRSSWAGMDKKLYVGNLSYNTTDVDLRALFEQAGVVETVELIKDRETGRSKGFAFVEMASQSEAEKAISMFNGTSLDNRQIKVNIARPREEKPRSSGYGSSGYGSSGGYGNRRQGNQNRNKSGGTKRY